MEIEGAAHSFSGAGSSLDSSRDCRKFTEKLSKTKLI